MCVLVPLLYVTIIALFIDHHGELNFFLLGITKRASINKNNWILDCRFNCFIYFELFFFIVLKDVLLKFYKHKCTFTETNRCDWPHYRYRFPLHKQMINIRLHLEYVLNSRALILLCTFSWVGEDLNRRRTAEGVWTSCPKLTNTPTLCQQFLASLRKENEQHVMMMS